VLDGSCPTASEKACDVSDPAQKLVCSLGRWASNGSCDGGEACNPANVQCEPITADCAPLNPGDRFCNLEDEVVECGPNLVSTTVVEPCEGRCVAADSSAQCVSPDCGDGKPQTGEECDDGNTENTDSCTELCKAPYCGDGFTNDGEACDDGNSDPLDACRNNCTLGVPQVALGSAHSCALASDGMVKCWGYNADGELGLGDTSFRGDQADQMGAALSQVALGTGRVPEALGAGSGQTCVVFGDGAVKCWGLNYYGSLGLGDTNNRGDNAQEMGDDLPVVPLGSGAAAKAVVVGNGHICALLVGGAVKCWGLNWYGELGLGDTGLRGATSLGMGDDLPALDLGTGRTAKMLVAGSIQNCALLDDESVKCWGYNSDGRLGIGPTSYCVGDEPGEMGDSLPSVSLGGGRTAKSLAAGSVHTCALLDDGSVKCWGNNGDGRLGLGDTVTRGGQLSDMGDKLATVALGSGRTAIALSAGDAHTCALLDDGSVKCWGLNRNGELGYGDNEARGDDSNEMGDSLPAVPLGTGRKAARIVAGGSHTCAILDDGSVKCWGGNNFGQLGLGDTNSRGDASDEMGDVLPEVSLW
jgi:cysteine-rich repeat protein